MKPDDYKTYGVFFEVPTDCEQQAEVAGSPEYWNKVTNGEFSRYPGHVGLCESLFSLNKWNNAQ